MATKNIENMNLEELVAYKASIKQKMDELRSEAQEANELYAQKVQDEHVERARVSMQAWAEANGKTLDQAIEYWEGRLTPDGDAGRMVQANLLQGKPGKAAIR